MSHRLAVLVACLVLTAGCNAVPLDDGRSSTPTDTLTPVPVAGADGATTSGPPDGQSFPPGVYANGTVNLTTLREAHNASIEGQSYTWVYRRSEVEEWTDDGTASQGFTRRVHIEGGDVIVTDGNLSYLSSRSVYLSGQKGFVRHVIDNVTDIQTVEPRGHREYAPSGELLRAFLADRTVTTDVIERDGERFYRLYTPPGRPPRGFDPSITSAVNISNYRMTAYVTPAGRIQTVGVEYDRTVTGQGTTRVSIRFEYRAVGETTVTRPEWVQPAWVSDGTPTPDVGRSTEGETVTGTGTGTVAARNGTARADPAG